MPQTRNDLIEAVLVELTIPGSGQPVAAEDAAEVEKRIDPTLATLSELGIFHVADAGAIEDAVFNPLVTYLAQVVAPKFGAPVDRVAMAQAEDTMRALARLGKGTGSPLRFDAALRYRRMGSGVI